MVYNPITAVGIDVSKSKNTVAIRRPRGEVVMQLFDVQHNTEDSHRIADCEKNIIHIWPCFCDRINFALPKNRPDVKFCVSVFRQSQEWRWKTGRILAWIP